MDNAKVISELKAVCQRSLLTLLDDMFASCDDLYFDLASRAESNTEQNVYFESMREVRVNTKPTIDIYTDKLTSLFSANPKNSNTTPSHSDNSLSDESLSLLGDEEMESNVALTNMATRARTLSSSELYKLERRLSILYNREINENNNPLDPQQLCELFALSTQTMSMNIKARIILYKQYERYVINRLPEIYSQANTVLDNAGIKITKDRRKQNWNNAPQSQQTETLGAIDPTAENPTSAPQYRYGAPAFNELSQLIQGLQHLSASGTSLNLPLFSSGSGPAIDQRELLELITKTQATYTRPGQPLDIRAYLQQTLAHEMPHGKARAVENVDEDVINLVAMFFDFILDDKSIPLEMQALISRLQIPILRIALKDRGFFSNSDHPARTFINEIARIGIGIQDNNDSQNKALLEKIESMIQHIHDHHTDNNNIFSDMLVEFEAFNEKMEKRASLVERRTSETAEGQAKTKIARLEAQRAIQENMDGRELPESISNFIVRQWQEVLFSTLLKHDKESQLWLDHLQTMQDLIWGSQKHTDEKSIKRFDNLKQNLYKKIQGGLTSISITAEQADELIKEIIQLHHDLSGNDVNSVAMETFKSEENSSMEALKQQKTWTEMTALERQKVKYQALEYDFIKKAESIDLGDWLEFKQLNSGTVTRCKLAAKLEASDSYIFVNRLGFKILEKARKEVAYDMQRDRARVLETGPAFERSLHRMVTNLKNITSQVRR